MALIRTDVSEDCIASIIRVTKSAAKNNAITTNWETIVIPFCNHYWNNSKEED
jgi:hypothetical protein